MKQRIVIAHFNTDSEILIKIRNNFGGKMYNKKFNVTKNQKLKTF